MKIDRIEIRIVAVQRIAPVMSNQNTMDFLLTKIHTDEDITGISEIPSLPPITRESAEEIFAVVQRIIGPKLIGQDPFNIEEIWRIMNRVSHVGVCPKGAIDMALYDIRGKTLDTPLFNLIGGLSKDKIPLVQVITRGTPEEMAEKAKLYVDEGYIGLRLKVGQPGKTDQEVLKAVRERVGWKIPLRVDANMAWNVPKAIKKIKEIEKFDIEFVEQPIKWYNMKGMAAVARAVDTPLAAHEALYTIQDVANLVHLGATDIIGVKAYRPGGGITGTMKVLAMAEIMGIPCYLHSAVEGGVCTAASVHICAAQWNHLEYASEVTGLPGFESDLVKNPLRIHEGVAHVPNGPGLGVELDIEAVERYTRAVAIIE